MRELKIGISWVRGVVGDALTPELVVNFSCAFGTWADGGPVVIGRDPRQSSSMLRAAVIAGLLSPGCEVIDLGVCPTPVVSFAVRELGAAGGLSITGSHNDSRWNALKFIAPDGTLLNAVKSEELLDIFHASAYSAARGGEPGITECPEVIDRYLEHTLSALDTQAIRAARPHVAVDFCNGSCHWVVDRFLQELGCTLMPLNESPSSRFAHPPSPTVQNMSQLQKFMAGASVTLGAAINVDGDRIAFVTPGGTALSEEYTVPLTARNRLARRPGAIVTNLSSSSMIETVAEEFGQEVIRTSVGEGHVMDRGLEEGAVLAGEGSGGVGALPMTMTFDATLTLGMILEMLAVEQTSLEAIVSELPHFHMLKGTLPCAPDQVYRLVQSFRGVFADQATNVVDGLRVSWSDGWLHVRASNTEPLLRIIVEANTEARAKALFEQAMAHARSLLGGA